jgi:protein-disulfide isomerase
MRMYFRFLKMAAVLPIAMALPLAAQQQQNDGITRQQADQIIEELRQIRTLLQQQGAKGAPQEPQPARARLNLEGFQMLGAKNAPLTVVEFTDYQCPFCQRFHVTAFNDLKKNYIDTGKVYFVFRAFPINGAADGAAEGLARCAGRTSADNYFHFIDLLFRNQKEWDPEFNPPDVHAGLLRLARIAGIEAQAEACMSDKANADRINSVAKDGVARYNINATPTLIINGVIQQPGYIPWTQLKSTLDSFLARK